MQDHFRLSEQIDQISRSDIVERHILVK